MEWLWIILAAGAAYVVWQRLRQPKAPAAPQATRTGLATASDRELMLATFRRELANYLVSRDPDRYLDLYRTGMRAEAAMTKADGEEREAQLTILTKRYPFYTDFDLIGTRPYVLYADALAIHADEEIEEHYLNLVKFQSLMRAVDPDWQYREAATSEKELEHLIGYVRKIKDTRFRQRLEAAVDTFYASRSSDRLTHGNGALAYENAKFAVYYVPHIAENRFGFHFKDTDEYGLYGSFHADDRDKHYQSFYRSDRRFEAETYLDYLRIDQKL